MLEAQEGAFGTHLLERDICDPPLMFGSGGVLPIETFQPIPMPSGSESEGISEIAFVPPSFPTALQGGLFAGFHGRFSLGGVANEENIAGFGVHRPSGRIEQTFLDPPIERPLRTAYACLRSRRGKENGGRRAETADDDAMTHPSVASGEVTGDGVPPAAGTRKTPPSPLP